MGLERYYISCFNFKVFLFFFICKVEDGGVATKPVDAAGLPPDVIVQLDRIATSPINKQRGFQMALAEDVKKYKSLALHPVPVCILPIVFCSWAILLTYTYIHHNLFSGCKQS